MPGMPYIQIKAIVDQYAVTRVETPAPILDMGYDVDLCIELDRIVRPL